jgi:hypothetical protein
MTSEPQEAAFVQLTEHPPSYGWRVSVVVGQLSSTVVLPSRMSHNFTRVGTP